MKHHSPLDRAVHILVKATEQQARAVAATCIAEDALHHAVHALAKATDAHLKALTGVSKQNHLASEKTKKTIKGACKLAGVGTANHKPNGE